MHANPLLQNALRNYTKSRLQISDDEEEIEKTTEKKRKRGLMTKGDLAKETIYAEKVR